MFHRPPQMDNFVEMGTTHIGIISHAGFTCKRELIVEGEGITKCKRKKKDNSSQNN